MMKIISNFYDCTVFNPEVNVKGLIRVMYTGLTKLEKMKTF